MWKAGVLELICASGFTFGWNILNRSAVGRDFQSVLLYAKIL